MELDKLTHNERYRQRGGQRDDEVGKARRRGRDRDKEECLDQPRDSSYDLTRFRSRSRSRDLHHYHEGGYADVHHTRDSERDGDRNSGSATLAQELFAELRAEQSTLGKPRREAPPTMGHNSTSHDVEGSTPRRSLAASHSTISMHAEDESSRSAMTVGKRQADEFLQEIKARHIISTDLENTRQMHVEPPDGSLRLVVDVLAKYVSRYGEHFEEAIRSDVISKRRHIVRDLVNEDHVDFSFLAAGADGPEAVYYRWRGFAFAQGDGLRRWRTEPVRMCNGGEIWHPPLFDGRKGSRSRSLSKQRLTRFRSQSPTDRNSSVSDRHDKERERRDKRDKKSGPPGAGKLSPSDRIAFARLLQRLSPQGKAIEISMVWCLERHSSAIEISKLLMDSLTAPALPITHRVLRLFLISDVVHNSASTNAPAAWCFHKEFEMQLPAAFEQLRLGFASEESRIAAGSCAEQVRRVLRAWKAHEVFNESYVQGLETSFCRDIVDSRLILRPDETQKPIASYPDEIFLKLAEWRSQHFSQLEKLGRSRGLNWQSSLASKVEDGRSVEEARTTWLIDRLATYELYLWECRMPATQSTPPPYASKAFHQGNHQLAQSEMIHAPYMFVPCESSDMDSSENLDGEPLDDIDGQSLSSGDMSYTEALDDFDGEPIANGPGSSSQHVCIEIDDDEDDDIDGVPLGEDFFRSPCSVVQLLSTTPSYDDLDGVPMLE